VGLVLLGLAFSLFHLGSPRSASRALANWRSSWLSREILFALLFALTSLLHAAMEGARPATHPSYGATIEVAAALFGLGLVISMAGAYRLRTVPAWDNWVTPVSFVVTAILLGGLAVGAFLTVPARWVLSTGAAVPFNPTDDGARSEMVRLFLVGIVVASAAALIVQLCLVPVWLVRLRKGPEAAAAAARLATLRYRGLLHLRIVLALAGALALVAVTILGPAGSSTAGSWSYSGVLLATAFSLVLAAEVLGRVLFYATRIRSGV
jgi:anaerobic dimethyl sulfoxide reductase subunit C